MDPARSPDLAGARWVTSRRSANGGNCVQVARNLPGIIAVRDSKDPSGPALTLTPVQWRAFTARLHAGPTSPA